MHPDVSNSELMARHKCIVPDLCLPLFALQYKNAVKQPTMADASTVLKQILNSDKNMQKVVTALARFLVAKPHSADVCRLFDLMPR
jgi:hypothetical protein